MPKKSNVTEKDPNVHKVFGVFKFQVTLKLPLYENTFGKESGGDETEIALV